MGVPPSGGSSHGCWLRREELDLAGNDLRLVAGHAILAGPSAALEPPADVDEPAFGQVLGRNLGQAAPRDHRVVLDGLSPVVRETEASHSDAVRRVAQLWICDKPADQCHPVDGWSAPCAGCLRGGLCRLFYYGSLVLGSHWCLLRAVD